ncbi:hypothetical protein AGMMS49546_11020 [Spirochaetia bacterium]|nr:hypothetical protein AGMMS49546_11020 [Spirochaetia bacterium]
MKASLKGSQMTEEEAWALDEEISKDEDIEFGPNGTGFLSMGDARLMGLKDPAGPQCLIGQWSRKMRTRRKGICDRQSRLQNKNTLPLNGFCAIYS